HREPKGQEKPGRSIQGGDAGCRCTPTEIGSPVRAIMNRQRGRSGASGCRQSEEERGTFVRPRLDPDPAAVALDDLPTDRKPDPGTGILVSGVQPAERFE